ncbi:MAG: hypothetical protein EYC62_07590 [Alphaproteobacteria bacterium]|nr:MAG: hypothetical protein EYC62_07590 [Alphaproteobacteria bacterium]
MRTPKTVYFLGGLQTHGRGHKAHAIGQVCGANRINFHVIDWQNPVHGHVDEWVGHIADTIPHFAASGKKVLVASSLAVWPALLWLAKAGVEAPAYVDHVVAVSPVVDATAKLASQLGDEKNQIDVPCGTDVPTFPLTRDHVTRAEPFLLGKTGHTWMQSISPRIGLTVMAGPDEQAAGNALMRHWPKGGMLWPEMQDVASAYKPVTLEGRNFERNEKDAALIATMVYHVANLVHSK